MARIKKEETRAARVQLAVFGFCALLSAAIMVPAAQAVMGEISQSGIFEYTSLFISDGIRITQSWSEFLILLAQALPLPAMTVFLASLFALCVSLLRAVPRITRAALPFYYS